MKTQGLASLKKDALIERIIGFRQKIYFRPWAQEIRKVIPVSEMSSAKLWRRYLEESKPVWDSLREIYSACSVLALQGVLAKEQAAAKECGKVIDMAKARER